MKSATEICFIFATVILSIRVPRPQACVCVGADKSMNSSVGSSLKEDFPSLYTSTKEFFFLYAFFQTKSDVAR